VPTNSVRKRVPAPKARKQLDNGTKSNAATELQASLVCSGVTGLHQRTTTSLPATASDTFGAGLTIPNGMIVPIALQMQGCDWDISAVDLFDLLSLDMTSSSMQHSGAGVNSKVEVRSDSIRLQQASHFAARHSVRFIGDAVQSTMSLANSEVQGSGVFIDMNTFVLDSDSYVHFSATATVFAITARISNDLSQIDIPQ